MRTYIILLLIVQTISFNLLAQVDLTRNICFNIGISELKFNASKYSLNDIANDYPELRIDINKLKNYRNDTSEKIVRPPFQLSLEYSTNANIKFKPLSRSDYRFQFSYINSRSFSERKLSETFLNYDTSNTDTIIENLNGYSWWTKAYCLNFGLVVHSKYFFKNKNNRLYIGMNLMAGLSRNSIWYYEVVNKYLGYQIGSYNNVPVYEHTSTIVTNGRGYDKNLGYRKIIGYYFSFGYENISLPIRRFGLGFRYDVGNSLHLQPGKKTIHAINSSYLLTLRFFIDVW